MNPIIIDTGIFDRPILIQNPIQAINNNATIVKEEVIIDDGKPVIIDTGIFDRPILLQKPQYQLNEKSKQVSQRSYVVQEGDSEVLVEEVVYEEYIDEDGEDADGEKTIVREVVEEVEIEGPNGQKIIRKVIPGEQNDTVIEEIEEIEEVEEYEEVEDDTGKKVIRKVIRTSSNEIEPDTEIVKELQTENQVQPTETVVEEVIEESNEKPIIVDTGIFDRPILIQDGVSSYQPKEVVVEEQKPIIVDTGIFDRPILIQDGVSSYQPKEVVVEEPIPECRADTGCWWLFTKPEPKVVIVDTGIFDRPILIQDGVSSYQPREVVVEEQKPIIIDTGIFDRPILIQDGVSSYQPIEVVVEEQKPIIVDTGIFDRPILIQDGVSSYQPIEVAVEEQKPIIVDTGIFDRPILIQDGVSSYQPREVVVEEQKPIIVDTGIFDRPILIQDGVSSYQPREVVAEEPIPECRADTGCWWLFTKPEPKVVIVDTGIFDRPILIQDGISSYQPKEAIVEEPIPECRADTGCWWLFEKIEPIPECRADTGCWWLFAKPNATEKEVKEKNNDVADLENGDSILKVHCKLPLGYTPKQWVPYGNRSIEVLTTLPLGYHQEDVWVPHANRSIEVLTTLPLGYHQEDVWVPHANRSIEVLTTLPLGYQQKDVWIPNANRSLEVYSCLPLGIDFHTPERQWKPYANRSIEVLTTLPLGYTIPELQKPIETVEREANVQEIVKEIPVPVEQKDVNNELIEQLKREIMIRDQLLKKKDEELIELKNIVDKKDYEIKSQNTDYQNLIKLNEELNHKITQLNIMNNKLQKSAKADSIPTPPSEDHECNYVCVCGNTYDQNKNLQNKLQNVYIIREIESKDAEIEKLTNKIVALNQQIAKLTLNVDESENKNRNIIKTLKSKADGYLEKLVKLNGQVSNLTLLLDEFKNKKAVNTINNIEKTESTSSTPNNKQVARRVVYLSPESREIITNIVNKATAGRCNILWILALLLLIFIYIKFWLFI